MQKSRNTFKQIMFLVLLLLIPILILYTSSNQISESVVRKEIAGSKLHQLSFFLQQVENNLEQFNMISSVLSRDSSITNFINLGMLQSTFEKVQVKNMVKEKINLQSASSNWSNQIAVYSVGAQETITTELVSKPSVDDVEAYAGHLSFDWSCRPGGTDGESPSFLKHTVYPASGYTQIGQAQLIIEISFQADNLQSMLEGFKENRPGNPFFYHPEYNPIVNRNIDDASIPSIISQIRQRELADSGILTMELEGIKQQVFYLYSESLGWYLIDYVPVQLILSPITASRNFFYLSVFLLLTLSVLVSFLLYRNVRIPIRELIKNVQQMKRGNYSGRITHTFHNEFDFLLGHFNEMSEQIQQLIEKVYAERLRFKDATLKQLQSQINPHFLYNCLFFIKNMTKLGDDEAVIKMSLYLGEYYRYTTRLEKPTATIDEEIRMITNYLEIQCLRMQRITYQIAIPDAMKHIPIPRLLLQPIVENSIVHGLEMKAGSGQVAIIGEEDEQEYRLIVEDNGVGMPAERLLEFAPRMQAPLEEEMGYGVWNVYQRLVLHFGQGAGIALTPVAHEGLRVTLHWPK
ncbi:MAG: hypothetical protein K0R57_1607 [Paenibacillaceae bacterium]|jgi:two-component system sensor histidine kinase YesM|nr:hypothetical protein [Paenibacillaceae bacterium]